MDLEKDSDRPLAPIHQQRRRADRVKIMESCPYEMSEAIGGGTIVMHQGEALSINISSGGMLLLMDQAPQVDQVLEILLPAPNKSTNALTLVEVRWTRQLLSEVAAGRYLVGVRSLFGPYFYE